MLVDPALREQGSLGLGYYYPAPSVLEIISRRSFIISQLSLAAKRFY
jgi:hypothetical protein